MVKRSGDWDTVYEGEDGVIRDKRRPGVKLVDRQPTSANGKSELDLSDLALSGGSGLLAYSIAKGMMEEDGEKKKKRNAFDRLLSELIPVGIGGLGAYAGHRLGQSMKTAADEQFDRNAMLFPTNSGIKGVAAYPPKGFNNRYYKDSYDAAGANNRDKQNQDEMKTWGDAARDAQMREENKKLLAQIGGAGALGFGAVSGGLGVRKWLQAKNIEEAHGGRRILEDAVRAANEDSSTRAVGRAVEAARAQQVNPANPGRHFNPDTINAIRQANTEELNNVANIARSLNPPPDQTLVEKGREARGKRFSGKLLGALGAASGIASIVSLLGLAPRFGENANNYGISYDTMTPKARSYRPVHDVRGYDSSR